MRAETGEWVVVWGDEQSNISQRPQRPRIAIVGTPVAAAQAGRAAIIDSQSVKTTEKGGPEATTRVKGEGTQTPHRGGYPGTAAGGGGASGRHSGPGRRAAGLTAFGGPLPSAPTNLGRRSLRGQTRGVGPEDRRLGPGTGAPARPIADLSGAAPPVGGGAHLRLAEPAAALEQGLRGIVRNHRNLAVYLNDRAHATPFSTP